MTMRHPVLWFFGLFVVGGFNLNFLRFQNVSISSMSSVWRFSDMVQYFTGHPGILALLSFAILVISVVSLLITNWARVMLVLYISSYIQKKPEEIPSHMISGKASLIPVTKMSIITSSLIVIVGAGLFLPPLLLGFTNPWALLLWLGGLALFLPIAFTISCINIFTTFFIVVFKNKFAHSLDLGTDFFLNNWTSILGLSLLLSIIYGVCFTVGISLITIIKLFFNQFFTYLVKFNFFSLSAMIVVPRLIAGLLLWLLIAGLNVFFNTALLLLFLQLIIPIKTPEAKAFSVVPEGV